MTNLQQPKYEGDNGQEVDASVVQVLAPYVHTCDGFYTWTCGACFAENGYRWWNISGRVLECPSCHKMNLLVRTNCKEITALTQRNFDAEYDKSELECLKAIEKYNKEELAKIKRGILARVQESIEAGERTQK